MPATEQAEPAAQGESGDAHRRATAGGDGPSVLVQCVVDLGQPGASPDPRPSVDVDRDRVEAAEVEQQTLGRGAAGEAVPAATRDDVRAGAPCVGDRAVDVTSRRAPDDRPWTDVPIPGLCRESRGVVAGRGRREQVPIERRAQFIETGHSSRR